MKNFSFLLIFFFGLFAVNPAFSKKPDTPTGQPEVVIEGVTVEEVKTALKIGVIACRKKHIYVLVAETDSQIVFDRELGWMATAGYITAYGGLSGRRMIFTLVDMGGNVRVLTELYEVVNLNSPREKLISLNDRKKPLKATQKLLETVKADMESQGVTSDYYKICK
ncbi:MAG: hypothetical protein IH901_06395 [Proteobacteria bacterium]|nr:hypothetical protein [Pseudomonadota bacterium]